MTNKTLITAALVLVLAWGAWWHFHRSAKMQYITTPVVRGSVTSAVQATGTINPVVNVTVGAQVSGRITKLFVDYNSHVRKGELLALIDPTTFEEAVTQSRADVSSAESAVLIASSNVQNAIHSMLQIQQNLNTLNDQINRDEATLANDQIANARAEKLVAKNLIAHSDADAAKYAYQSQQAAVAGDQSLLKEGQEKLAAAKVQIEVAKQQVQSSSALRDKAQAQLSQAVTNLNYTHILSPVDGVVVARNVDVGQTVVSSFQAPSLFVIAQDLKQMQIDTQVDEASVGRIKLHGVAKFNVSAFPDDDFVGSVKQIRINPIVQQNVVNYDVVVGVSNDKLRLLPGMTATVNLIVAERNNVLLVPNQALRFVPPSTTKIAPGASPGPSGGLRGQGAAGEFGGGHRVKQPHVWILQDNRLVKQDVVLGITDDSNTEVISGLKEGDLVVTDATSTASKTTANPFAAGGRR